MHARSSGRPHALHAGATAAEERDDGEKNEDATHERAPEDGGRGRVRSRLVRAAAAMVLEEAGIVFLCDRARETASLSDSDPVAAEPRVHLDQISPLVRRAPDAAW